MIIFESDVEVSKRKREVQIILNIVEPDPEYQPTFISDKATIFDLIGNSENEIKERLEFYFHNLVSSLDLTLPIWKLIDTIKLHTANWPDLE